MRRFSLLAILVLALAGVAAGCGGDDDAESDADPTAAWADGFCTAVTNWRDELQTVTEQFSDGSNFSEDGLKSAAEDVSSATQALVDDLRGLGAPDTDSGEEVKRSLDTLSTTLETESSAIEDTANGVSNLAEAAGAAPKILSSLSALGTAFSQTLQTIQDADVSGELQSALENSPECTSISSS